MSETEIIQRIDNRTDDFINNLKLKIRMDDIKKEALDELVLLLVKLEYIYNAIRGVGSQSPQPWEATKTQLLSKVNQQRLSQQPYSDALNEEINNVLDKHIDREKMNSLVHDYEYNGQTKKSIFDGKYNSFILTINPNDQTNPNDFTMFNNQIKIIDTVQEYYYYNISNFNTNLLPENLELLKKIVESNNIYVMKSFGNIKSSRSSIPYFPVNIPIAMIPTINSVFIEPFGNSNLAKDCIIEYLNIYIKMITNLLNGHDFISMDLKGGFSKKSRKYRNHNNKTRNRNKYRKISKYRK